MKLNKWLVLGLVCAMAIGVGACAAKKEEEVKSHTVYFGLFREGAPAKMYKIQDFEKEYGRKPQMIMWYLDWSQPFPAQNAKNVIDYGSVPVVIWEPWIWGDEQAIKLQNIADGEWDTYINAWAKGVKDFKYPIFIRFAHEFNIEGYPWCIVNNNQDYELYIEVFQKVVKMFRAAGANNALFVWNPMNYSYPTESWNDYLKAYPGDEYVDWIGIDGYNWGTAQTWSDWQTFEQVFVEPVRILSTNFPNKPIMLAEFGTAIDGGDKAQWFAEIPAYLQSTMKNVHAILYFDIKKETDWRINSTPESQAAFKKIMANPVFDASVDDIPTLKVNNLTALEKKSVDIKKAKSAPTIDGDLGEWGKAEAYVVKGFDRITSGAPKWTGDKDLSSEGKFMYDSDNFYIAIKVTDDKPFKVNKKDADIWNADAVEIAMSTDSTLDPKRNRYLRNDFQIGISPGDNGSAPMVWSWQLQSQISGAKVATKKTSDGYILEVSIPWSGLRTVAPKSGQTVGFTFAIDDADDADDRETQQVYSGDNLFYKDPSVWGTATYK